MKILKSFSRKISFGKNFTLPLKNFKFHRLQEDTLPKTTSITKTEAIKFYKDMTAIRLMENEAGKLYMEKQIKGFCHLYSGQEACAVGVESAIDTKDSVITAYRSHGYTYTRGIPIAEIMSELTGRVTGCSKGKGGSMHTYAPEFYGGNGIVGAHVPVGAGIALAHKLRGNGRICVTLYGDGAANQGQVFEAYNMAALWKLPVVFMCENNQYGMGTHISRAAACSEFYTRGDYIPGIKVHGNCVLSVREATKFCRNWCLAKKGPIVVELVTYRYSGHSMSDPGTSYRTPEDVQKERKSNDPIAIFAETMIENKIAAQAELDEIRDALQQEVDEGRERALSDAFPPMSHIALHVFKGGCEGGYARGCTPFVPLESSS